jgi:dTDP-4-dehydrorhamnose reductase
MGRAPDWQSAEEKPVVILGAGGMITDALIHRLEETGQHYHTISAHDLDITYEGRVAAVLKGLWPGIVINNMGNDDVDGAEDDRDAFFELHGEGGGNVARVCRELDALMVQLSSHMVFDGLKDSPYLPGDPVSPVNNYGASRYEGERQVIYNTDRHLVIRTSWLFGPGGDSFLSNILARAKTGEKLKVVNDQAGSPTFSRDLARGLLKMANLGTTGTFHLANSGGCTWYELAEAALSAAGIQVDIEAITSVGYPTRAARPKNAVLDSSAAYEVLGEELPEWRDAVKEYIELV